jgi:hypothetical protein
MRVAPESGTDETPVSLAPTPEATNDSTLLEPASAPALAPVQDTTPAQAYAPYGGNESPLEVRRIGQWTHTGVREARRLIIQDANAWAAFWSELGVGEQPAVDFSRNVVIAVAAGERSSGGHEIAVTKVSQKDGSLNVEVLETVPGPNCLSASSLSQPVDVVVVQGNRPKSWSFVERKEVRGCRS